LHEAAEEGYRDAVAALLAGGCDPNMPDGKGRVALHYAMENGEVEISEMLLRGGGSLAIRDAKGETPVDALEDSCRLRLLVEGDYEELKSLCEVYGEGTDPA
jgi:ankyrin repeat protein